MCPEKTSEVRRKYEFIKSKQGEYNVRMMCRVLDVAASGYYAWLKTPISNHAREDARLLRLIQASINYSQCIYRAPRVFLDLREAVEKCSKYRVARLICENGMGAEPGYRAHRYLAGKSSELIPNLVNRNLDVSQPNKVWLTDITDIRTREDWLYVAVVLNLFSRKVTGWAARLTIHCEVVLDAVLLAVRRQRPRKTIIHSDLGFSLQ